LDNVFRAGAEHAVLGAAWSAPPAVLQPAIFEPPYVAACLPAGRGDGTLADDVYALGVLVLCLALGRVPMAGMDDAAVIRRKLDLGSYDALVGDERLAPAIADLVRGMLAEDPDHRPTPLLLTDPPAARARRVAARPPRRAQRGLEVSGTAVWDARALAYAMCTDTDQAVRLLHSNAIDGWLRRGLGDAGLASRLDEVMRLRSGDGGPEDARADALLVTRAITVLDPLAPLCWRGLALWPDGIGPALAEVHAGGPTAAAPGSDAGVSGRIEEIVHGEVVASWAAARPERCDGALLRLDARQSRSWLRAEEPGGGLWRTIYGLNPLLPCASPLLQGRCVARLVDLLPALETVAAKADRRATPPIDRQIAAFIAARFDQRVEGEMSVLGDERQNTGWPLVHLRLLARLQQRLYPAALPALAAWMAEQAAGTLTSWRNRKLRARMQTKLSELAGAGQLGPMLNLLEDPTARAADSRGAALVTQAVARIDAELADIAGGAPKRAEQARRIGQEIAAGAGLAALAVVLGLAALS
jgi:hypothetical protein